MMENGDSKDIKDIKVLKNGADFDILRKDEAFWQQTVANLASEQISATKDENVSIKAARGSDS
jgi:hypothetical protein